MNNGIAGMLSRKPYVVKAWLMSRFLPFYQSLSPLQRTCFMLAMIPMPIYVFQGQVFLLLDAIQASIQGHPISILPFVALLTETLLIIYTFALALQFQASVNPRITVPKDLAGILPHGCITVRAVPLHLYNEERKTAPVEDTDFIKGFAGLGVDDQELVDRLPEALEILRNNAAMIDIYEQYHPKETTLDEPAGKSKSLLDILRETNQPQIETASDLEHIIQS